MLMMFGLISEYPPFSDIERNLTVGNADDARLITNARNQQTAALWAKRIICARQIDVADVDIVKLRASDVVGALESRTRSHGAIHFVLRKIAREMQRDFAVESGEPVNQRVQVGVAIIQAGDNQISDFNQNAKGSGDFDSANYILQ
jgi:hypothetical protein